MTLPARQRRFTPYQRRWIGISRLFTLALLLAHLHAIFVADFTEHVTFVNPPARSGEQRPVPQTDSVVAAAAIGKGKDDGPFEKESSRSRLSRLTTTPNLRQAPTSSGSLPYTDNVREFLKLPAAELSESLLVIVSILVFACRTLSLNDRTDTALFILDDFIQALFLLEYLFRWYGQDLRPSYLVKPEALVDALSFLPLVYSVATGDIFLGKTSASMQTFNQLDVLSIIRVLKLQRFLNTREAFVALTEMFWSGASTLRPWQLQFARTVYALLTLLFVSSGFVYTFEHSTNPQFPNFFVTLYFGLTTLTTVGFGDITPITDQGRLMVCISIIFGVTVVPLQLSSLAQALLQEFTETKNEGQAVDTLAKQLIAYEDEGGSIVELFNKMDKRGKGEITFVQAYEYVTGDVFDDLSLVDVQRLRKFLDDNGDGRIDCDELQNFVDSQRIYFKSTKYQNSQAQAGASSSRGVEQPRQDTISWQCKRCNEQEHPSGAAFCFRCGTALRDPPSESSPEPTLCLVDP